jgi:hypothetical protein
MQIHTRLFGGLIATTLVLTSLGVSAGESAIALKGAEEVPAVTTMAEGSGKFTVSADGTVAGSLTTKSMVGVAAHIHLGAPGKNGPPVVMLEKTSESTWSAPLARS